jgi:uncharacterized protein YbjT (DUF2867 family)
MPSPILITGGTGTLGRRVVALLRDSGHDLRVLSRHPQPASAGVEFLRGDLTTGGGVERAVQGAPIVVHCAGSATGDEVKARSLVRAASRAGVPHLVYISVVGAGNIPLRSRADRTMFGYFGSKLAAERVIAASGLPFTTLRATQFYDLILLVAQQLTKLPVIPTPTAFRFQPVDSGEVAKRLVELTLGEPAGRVSDLGGPHTYTLPDLVRGYLSATHHHRILLPVRIPGHAARAIRAGANLVPQQAAGQQAAGRQATSQQAVGQRTWEEFLADQLGGTE